MALFIVLGIVMLITFAVLGVLFYMLSKEGQKSPEDKGSLTDIAAMKKETTSSLLEPQKPKLSPLDQKIIPPFEPVVTLPTQQVQVPLEEDIYKKRAVELENELKAISEKAQNQSDEARVMMESLTEENESLKRQKANLEQAQQQLKALEIQASTLSTENTHLQGDLDATNAKVHLLEDQMAAVKIQMGEEISRANAAVAQLNQEKEDLLSKIAQGPDDNTRQELESLKAENLSLKQKFDDLEKAQLKLREENTHLMEKNELIQYEMIKARAQSSGLERVCFNYKNQLDDFFKKVNSVEVNNDQLAQVKSRLEAQIEEIRLQNEDLLKRDQLSQFELEKSRSRLVNLERECEDLKARAQQKDSQV